MKIGVCAPIESATIVKNLGYDYLETTFAGITSEDEETFRTHASLAESSGLPIEVCNVFFSKPERLYDPHYDFHALADYVERGAVRASSLGVRVLVIGSGKIRSIPDDFPRRQAEERFAAVLSTAGDILDRHQMSLVVEPLSKSETNFIHTVQEGVDIARMAHRPNVGGLVDFYHFFRNRDDIGIFSLVGDDIIHAHLARPHENRDAPYKEDLPVLRQWAEALRHCPNLSRISLECSWKPSFEEAIERACPLMDVFRSL